MKREMLSRDNAHLIKGHQFLLFYCAKRQYKLQYLNECSWSFVMQPKLFFCISPYVLRSFCFSIPLIEQRSYHVAQASAVGLARQACVSKQAWTASFEEEAFLSYMSRNLRRVLAAIRSTWY